MIQIKVVSPKGHDLLELDANAAVEKLQSFVDEGKWVSMNGEIVTREEITTDLVMEHEVATVTNALVGG